MAAKTAHRSLMALVAAAALTFTSFLTPLRAEAAPDRADAGVLAASYIASELKANDYRMPSFSGEPGTVDWGLTIDALLALAATGVGKDVATQVAGALKTDGWEYIQWAQKGSDMGSFAKLAFAYEVAGMDPTKVDISQMTDWYDQYGGASTLDLIQALRDAISTTGQVGTSNHFGQALAILALARTAQGVPQKAVDYVFTLQCTDESNTNYGGFGYGGCTSVDGDATGMELSALVAAGLTASDARVARAITWMTSRQNTDGSFTPSHDPTLGNTNSTGLMGQVARQLDTSATRAVADKAEQFIESLQVTCDSPYALGASDPATGGGFWSGWKGSIAYSAAGFTAASSSGLQVYETDQWRRATTQAALGLDGAQGMSQLSTAGARADIPAPSCTLTGADPTVTGTPAVGQTLTAKAGAITNGNSATHGTPAVTWQWLRGGTIIANATSSTYVVATVDQGTALSAKMTAKETGFTDLVRTSTAVSVAAQTTPIVVTAPKTPVGHGTSTQITVSGLRSGEAYTLTVSGQRFASGTASAGGTASATVAIPLGWNTISNRPVVVTGADGRTGTATLSTVGAKTFAVSAPKVPAGHGTSGTITASGFVAGESYTVRVSGQLMASGKATNSGTVSATVKIPLGWNTISNRPVVVSGQWAKRTGSTTLSTVGARTFSVSASKTAVRVGTTTKVTASGLVAGESYKVYVSGQLLASGRATNSGTVSASFRIPANWNKISNRPVVVNGQWAKRTGSTRLSTTR